MKKQKLIGTDAMIIGKGIGRNPGIGFAGSTTEILPAGQFILDHSSIYNVTIASTGNGKGRGAIIPNLISNPTTSVVLDPKGENCLVTLRSRRLLGNQVVCLDPFQLVSSYSDSCNPFDSYRINPKQDPMTFAQSLAGLIGENGSEKDFLGP